ncbi:MAG TPA: glycoside hydrolase family 65 protein, partial [Rhodanobacteraceae bacterium]|nr:glycoside hydrolase family 65 protein [Rhodanobacteraceae bacterium]
MKFPPSTLCCLFAFAFTAPAMAQPATDPSFLLTATSKDFGVYFPSYLANGYFSTMTSVRGTEPDRAYMVAFMDYTKGDISRPAAIPGWSEIDYDPGTGWMNSTRLDPAIFSGYSQTLNMHDGTLTTRYRFRYVKNPTDVQVETFVSQADPHLAATRLIITPQFDGKVHLRFPFRLWSRYKPRFPIASMTGDQMIDAVIASGQNLNDKAVPTPDRAPVWYPGTTVVTSDAGDSKQLTLWLDGQAVNGLKMAEAAAIELPRGLEIEGVKLEKTSDKLSLDVVARVHKGTSYTFTKYIAASRQDWGGDATADLALAVNARTTGFDKLLARHVAAWHDLWKADIVVDHDEAVQRALHSDLYYLLSNTTVGTAWAMGACALTPNYAGHVFWDSDSWVFPALLLLHPERAKSIVMFRHRTMQ